MVQRQLITTLSFNSALGGKLIFRLYKLSNQIVTRHGADNVSSSLLTVSCCLSLSYKSENDDGNDCW